MSMSNLPDWIKTIVDLKPKFWFVLWLLGGLVLFLPRDATDRLGFTPTIDPYRGWIGLATLAAFVFWLVQLGLWKGFKQWWSTYKSQSQTYWIINSLSADEKLRLAYCLDRNRPYIWLDVNDPAAVSLRQKGLLVMRLGDTPFGRTHHVEDLFWAHLQKNKSSLFQESYWHDPEIRRSFDQFDGYLSNPLSGPDF